MKRFVIFGLLGPVASYLFIHLSLQTGWAWRALLLAYGIEVVPFIVSALIDHWLKDARAWERMVVAAISGFMTSALAVPVAATFFVRGDALGFAVLGIYAAIPAACCSLLSTATDGPMIVDQDTTNAGLDLRR